MTRALDSLHAAVVGGAEPTLKTPLPNSQPTRTLVTSSWVQELVKKGVAYDCSLNSAFELAFWLKPRHGCVGCFYSD